MSQPLVLAIEPDLRQAAIIKRVVREKALADVIVVDSRDAAIEALRTSMPDVLLLTALLSPRDEDDLMAHLRTLDNAGHLQTHTIPQLASALGPGEGKSSRGLLSAFRRKKEPEPIAAGCDPDLFAEEVRVFLQRAADKKRELASMGDNLVQHARVRPGKSEKSRATQIKEEEIAADAPVASSWESPFEWKPSAASTRSAPPPEPPRKPEPAFVAPVVDFEPEIPPMPVHDEPVPEPSFRVIAEPPVAEPVGEPIVQPVVEPAAETEREPEPAFAAAPIEPEPVPLTVAEAPLVMAAEPEPEPESLPEPVLTRPAESVVLQFDPPPVETPRHEPVRDRAEKIVARVQESAPKLVSEKVSSLGEDWNRPARGVNDFVTDRPGPLARWARSEPIRKPKPAAVSADDVRALMASLAVPTAVAWISYPRNVRIRRVRVPAAPDADSSDSVGAVILSRRILAEQRKQPTA